MSINGGNTCEDAEMAECDGEKVVTMMDVLQEQEEFEEDANAVLGASDEKNCTFSKGYINRQAIYACMTCCAEAKEDPTKRAGVCLACSLSCHENHELIELYTKRNFRCDCGNTKFNNHPCQFTPNKAEINEDNIYNQNFSGLYCVCHRPYPDLEATTEQEMIQCIVCEDWLHSSHLDAIVPPNDMYTEMICKTCMEKNEFLHDYSDFTVIKESMDVDILNVSSEVNDSMKCNGVSNTETCKLDEPKINLEGNTSELKLCDSNTQVVGLDIDSQAQSIEDQNTAVTSEHQENDDNKDLPLQDVTLDEKNVSECDNDKLISDEESKIDQSDEAKSLAENISETEHKEKEQTECKTSETSSCDQIISEIEQDNNVQTEENKSVCDTENINEQCEESESATDPKMEMEHENKEGEESTLQTEGVTDNITTQPNLNETDQQKNSEEAEIIKPSNDDVNMEAVSLNDQTTPPVETTDKPNICNQEQLEEDLLLADPVDIQDESKEIDNNPKESVDIDNNPKESVDIDQKEISELNSKLPDNKSNDFDTNTVAQDNVENKTQISADIIRSESSTDNVENNDVQEDNITENSNVNNEITSTSSLGPDILKRKHESETVNDIDVKKPKLEKECSRPRGVKRVHQGATFWQASFRHKLCTCNECITMYKDLSVLFLVDPEDSVIAYEALGKEKTDGKPVSQYEKGMAALSSLGRVQQINALTEYTKMRDKLLEFLKSFKDRKVIVKEEDIKAFFAGMKPVREPDGVYFCR